MWNKTELKMKTINLPRSVVNKLMTLAQKQPDSETCGLIGSVDNTATTVYPVNNIAADKKHLFEMNPGEQIHAMKKMREQKESLFAIYH